MRYTWGDYRSWSDDRRWEIIGGEAYAMTPAPPTRHQGVVGELFAQLRSFLGGKGCRVFVAPIDVKLTEEDVVQPDIVVVCDKAKIKLTHINGAPTLVVEVLSLSSALQDRGRKLNLYAQHGVKEVWIVTPYPSLVEVLQLSGDFYRMVGAYGAEDVLRSAIFRSLRIGLAPVFDFPLEPGEKVGMVKEQRPPYVAKRKSHGEKG